jgi:hypothetical protein
MKVDIIKEKYLKKYLCYENILTLFKDVLEEE